MPPFFFGWPFLANSILTAAPLKRSAPLPPLNLRCQWRSKPVAKATPAVLIPQIDEKEKLVNERIKQANDFIKNGDILNALTVVLEAKKIKMTEPLRLLEEQITKKIREDESRAAEQNQTAQSMVQSEDQDYAKAEAENTLAAWQNFLVLYPQGEFSCPGQEQDCCPPKKKPRKKPNRNCS